MSIRAIPIPENDALFSQVYLQLFGEEDVKVRFRLVEKKEVFLGLCNVVECDEIGGITALVAAKLRIDGCETYIFNATPSDILEEDGLIVGIEISIPMSALDTKNPFTLWVQYEDDAEFDMIARGVLYADVSGETEGQIVTETDLVLIYNIAKLN